MEAIKAQMKVEFDNKANSSTSRVYYLPSVPAEEDSPEYALQITPRGTLYNLRISCESSNYDISVRTREGALQGSAFEIFNYPGINKNYGTKGNESVRIAEAELTIPYVNEDQPMRPYLYIKISNHDTNESGLITLRITVIEG